MLKPSDSQGTRSSWQVLFLVVVIAGAHGLWLLPTILSLARKTVEDGGRLGLENRGKGVEV